MSEGFSNPIIGGGGALVYPSIHSPNFNTANPPASPTPSWAVLKTGIAYFFGLVVAGGTITGPDYIINPNGIFFYSGTPAADNLSASVVPEGASTADPFGNVAFPGFGSYVPFGGGGYVSYTWRENQTVIRYGLHMSSWTSTFPITTYQPTITGGVIQSFFTLLGGPLLIDLGFTAVTLDANWSTLAGQPVPSYMKTNDGMVHLAGAIQFNVNIANTNINGGHPLPGTAPGNGYRPSTEIFIAGAPGAAGVTIQTNGVLVAAQAPGQATVFCNFNGRYPLNL